MMRLMPGLVRIPDVGFVARERFPCGKISSEAVLNLAPDLAIEVFSEGNTKAEMILKRTEYFEAGARLVWLIDPKGRTATVFTGPDQSAVLHEGESLDGGELLAGFTLPLREIFEAMEL